MYAAPEAVVGGTGCRTKKVRLGKRVKREIYVARGLEMKTEKVYGEHNRLKCFYTGWIRCLGYGGERMGDFTWYGPRGASKYLECRKAIAARRERERERNKTFFF